MAISGNEQRDDRPHGHHQSRGMGMYLRFGAMILTAMVVMYWTMFIGSWELSHVRWSRSRLFMALTMGGTMGLVMLAWTLNRYRNTQANLTIVAVSVILVAGGTALDHSQTTVQDTSFMSAVIPHHSLAITRSERAELRDAQPGHSAPAPTLRAPLE